MTKKQAESFQNHALVPKHEKISDKDKKELLTKYDIKFSELPKISIKDAAIATLEPKENDVIKITRITKDSESIYYRRVINE